MTQFNIDEYKESQIKNKELLVIQLKEIILNNGWDNIQASIKLGIPLEMVSNLMEYDCNKYTFFDLMMATLFTSTV